MIGRIDDYHDNPDYIYLIGSDRLSTELHQISEEVNDKYINLELDYKYNDKDDPNRYYTELTHKFEDLTKVVIYVVSFGFLSLHLLHGFSSSFQSMGVNNKYSPIIKIVTTIYSIGIPFGFSFIAIFHYLNH